MVAAFPAAKLGSIALKQLSKPFATRIKAEAKRSPLFRHYICMPPAQLYHWIEVNIKMRMLNLGKPTDVPKLNETMAIELGAELLGEGIVFVVAAACLIAEYRRSSNRERGREEQKEELIRDICNRLTELELRLEEQNTRTRELGRVTAGIHTSVADWWKTSRVRNVAENKTESTTQAASKNPASKEENSIVTQESDIIHRALEEVDRTLVGKQR